MSIIQILILAYTCLSSLLVDDVYANGTTVFWSYLIVILIEIVQKRRISLVIIFMISFLFMIPNEAIMQSEELYFNWGPYYTNKGFSFLVLSSSAIFAGYKIADIYFSNRWKFKLSYTQTIIKNRKAILLFIILYNIAFFIINLNNTITGLTIGRNNAFPFLYSTLLYAIAYLTIGMTDKLFKNKITTILISLPIIITLIATGTRFLLVFIIFILFFQYLYEINFKRMISLFVIGIFLIIGMNTLKSIRSSGILSDTQKITKIKDEKQYNNITEKILSYGSSEGLVRNAAMISKYTNEVDYTYGKSFGFIAIFWIPRAIWPEKPTMLDSWLVNEYYTTYGDGYSSASSYGGELYMDFGFVIACIILFFLGFYLCRINYWIQNNYKTDLMKYILSGFLYGWMFFATRSILTSSFMLIWILISSYLIFNLFQKLKIIEVREKSFLN